MTDHDEPNEAYEIVPMEPQNSGPALWASRKAEAERYATDPAHRAEIRDRRSFSKKAGPDEHAA
jgi:hypothetical protein